MANVRRSRHNPIEARRYDEELARTLEVIDKAKAAIARAKKALNKSHAIRDQAKRLAETAAQRRTSNTGRPGTKKK